MILVAVLMKRFLIRNLRIESYLVWFEHACIRKHHSKLNIKKGLDAEKGIRKIRIPSQRPSVNGRTIKCNAL